MLSEMLNGEGVIVDQQAFVDELNNNNGFLETTSTAQNGTNASFDDFFGGWLNQVRSFLLCLFAYVLTICFVISILLSLTVTTFSQIVKDKNLLK
jgi:hypothetical protein